MFCASQSTISITKNLVHHDWTKHIGLNHHFIFENVNSNKVELSYMFSRRQIADILTNITKENFWRFQVQAWLVLHIQPNLRGTADLFLIYEIFAFSFLSDVYSWNRWIWFGVGVVLMQHQRPLVYYSQALLLAPRLKTVYERELIQSYWHDINDNHTCWEKGLLCVQIKKTWNFCLNESLEGNIKNGSSSS